MRAYPPEFDEEPPETFDLEVAIVWCFDCKSAIGPDLSEDVGYIEWKLHEDHETELVDKWIEVQKLQDDGTYTTEDIKEVDEE